MRSSDIPDPVLQLLHPEELQHAKRLPRDTQRQWIAGRRCLTEALKAYGSTGRPILVEKSGGPTVPAGHSGSISHKGPLSLGLALATNQFERVGVDLEYTEPRDEDLAVKVLTSNERNLWKRAATGDLAVSVTAHFALKEAIYKAATLPEQQSMEFSDIELQLRALSLEQTSRWSGVGVAVHGCQALIRGFVLREGPWIVAVATRSAKPRTC